PPTYDGSRKDYTNFMYRVQLYMDRNKEVFTDDTKKIVFLLSFLTKGEAASCAELFLTQKYQAANGGEVDYGKWKDFYQDFKSAFESQNIQKDALYELNNLRMKGNTAEEHVVHFKTL
ncbi:hypothetical protein CPC08DRAFT_620610, partial [Agrocybe pediades]